MRVTDNSVTVTNVLRIYFTPVRALSRATRAWLPLTDSASREAVARSIPVTDALYGSNNNTTFSLAHSLVTVLHPIKAMTFKRFRSRGKSQTHKSARLKARASLGLSLSVPIPVSEISR